MGIQRQKRADDVHAQIAVFHQQPSAPESRFRRPRHRVVAHMIVADAIQSGQLVELLPEYAMTYDPLYLYYPSLRGNSNIFKLIMDTLKVKAV